MFSYHTWQFIIFTIFTITACIISYSLRISFWTQDLALQQTLSSIDLFLFHRTDYTDSRTMLNGCTGKCARLSRLLVGFRTHFKSLHALLFIHSFHSFIPFLSVKFWLDSFWQCTTTLNHLLLVFHEVEHFQVWAITGITVFNSRSSFILQECSNSFLKSILLRHIFLPRPTPFAFFGLCSACSALLCIALHGLYLFFVCAFLLCLSVCLIFHEH